MNARFELKAGDLAAIKVTAPREIVRNRKALPDPFESMVIRDHLLSPQWSKGKIFAALDKSAERPAYRVLVPEYYNAGCLRCHGHPKDELDITGYPKEGRKLGELGGVISIHLFDASAWPDK